MGNCECRFSVVYNAFVGSGCFVGIFSRRFTSESRRTVKVSLFSSLTGFLGCDLIVSGFIALPFS